MSKFRSGYITSISKFEDFILTLYVIIDDLYQSYTPHCVRNRKNIQYAKLSDSEIITIRICGELVGIDSEKHGFLSSARTIDTYFRIFAVEADFIESENRFFR